MMRLSTSVLMKINKSHLSWNLTRNQDQKKILSFKTMMIYLTKLGLVAKVQIMIHPKLRNNQLIKANIIRIFPIIKEWRVWIKKINSISSIIKICKFNTLQIMIIIVHRYTLNIIKKIICKKGMKTIIRDIILDLILNNLLKTNFKTKYKI